LSRMQKLLVCLWLAGCGGKTGTIQLDIVVSPVDDPFTDATTVRITVGDAKHIKSYPVSSGGHFSFSEDMSPLSSPGPITVDALDATGNVVGHGHTPIIPLSAASAEYSVWVGRPGKVAGAATSLASPLAEMGAAYLPGYGVLYTGGRISDASAVKDASLFSEVTQTIVPPLTSTTAGIQSMTNARAGCVAVATQGTNVVSVAGSSASGFGVTTMPLDNAESFTPLAASTSSGGIGSYGTWTTLTSKIDPPRSFPNAVMLGNGTTLISGGFDESGAPLDTAVLLPSSGTVQLNPLSTPMAAPRAQHAAAAATFADGTAGALLVGGLASGSNGPVAEKLVSQSFTAYDVPGLENRLQATATTLLGGTILVLGGTITGTAVPTGVLIDTSNEPPTVTAIPNALSTARAAHTATLAGGILLVCGGFDAQGNVISSCDVLDATTGALTGTLALANGRRGHSALEIPDTNIVVIAGGFGQDGSPLSTIEIYTE
jgi:hypothetical protein